MTPNPPPKLQKVLKRFDLFWGIAPKGSLKYKRGQEVKQFLTQEIRKALKDSVGKDRDTRVGVMDLVKVELKSRENYSYNQRGAEIRKKNKREWG